MRRLVFTLPALLVAALLVGPDQASAQLTSSQVMCPGNAGLAAAGDTSGLFDAFAANCDDSSICPTPTDGEFDALVGEVGESVSDTVATYCVGNLLPAIEGACAGDDPSEVAGCVASANAEATSMVVDALLGGEDAQEVVIVSPDPEVVIVPGGSAAPRCAVTLEPCFGPGITRCCRGLECKLGGNGRAVCVPAPGGYTSPSKAFLQPTGGLLR